MKFSELIKRCVKGRLNTRLPELMQRRLKFFLANFVQCQEDWTFLAVFNQNVENGIFLAKLEKMTKNDWSVWNCDNYVEISLNTSVLEILPKIQSVPSPCLLCFFNIVCYTFSQKAFLLSQSADRQLFISFKLCFSSPLVVTHNNVHAWKRLLNVYQLF